MHLVSGCCGRCVVVSVWVLHFYLHSKRKNSSIKDEDGVFEDIKILFFLDWINVYNLSYASHSKKIIQTGLVKQPWGWCGVAHTCMHLNRWCRVFVRLLVFRSYTLNNPKSFRDILKCPNVFSSSSHQSADTVAHRCSEIAQKLEQIPPTRTARLHSRTHLNLFCTSCWF